MNNSRKFILLAFASSIILTIATLLLVSGFMNIKYYKTNYNTSTLHLIKIFVNKENCSQCVGYGLNYETIPGIGPISSCYSLPYTAYATVWYYTWNDGNKSTLSRTADFCGKTFKGAKNEVFNTYKGNITILYKIVSPTIWISEIPETLIVWILASVMGVFGIFLVIAAFYFRFNNNIFVNF